MNITKYKRRNWSREPISEHFSAVASIYKKIQTDLSIKTSENRLKGSFDYNSEVKFMTGLMSKLSYSDDFTCTVKAAAIASAEVILQDLFINKQRRRWSSLHIGEFHEIARTAQRHMAKTISKYGVFESYDRVTDISIIMNSPRLDINGVSCILRGSMSTTSTPPRSNGHRITGPTQFESLKLNIHPKSAVKDPIEWFGVQWHENFHGMEAILLRDNQGCMGQGQFDNDNNSQLLISNYKVVMDADFRDVAYDVYRASPSERLARMGQEAFVNRMMVEQLVCW